MGGWEWRVEWEDQNKDQEEEEKGEYFRMGELEYNGRMGVEWVDGSGRGGCE